MNPTSQPASGAASILASLNKDVQAGMSKLETAQPEVNLEEKIKQIQHELDKTSEIKDPGKRDDARRVLEANLETVRQSQQSDQDELAELVLGLDVLMKDVGQGLEDLLKFSPDEQARIDGAKQRIEDAKAALTEANGRTGLKALFGKGAAIEAAAAELAEAEKALPLVQAEVARLSRTRLHSGNIEQNMQVYTSMTQRTVAVMAERNKKTGSQLQIVRTRLTEAQSIKKMAAESFQKLEESLNAAEADLRMQEDLLTELTNGSPEYTEQEKKIVDLRAQAEAVRGEKNTAMMVYQSKEKFVAILEGHLIATRRIFDNQKIWLAKLQSDAEERQVTWINRLETMKAMADLEVAGAQDSVGAKIDLADARYVAEASGAADRHRQSMMEDQPEQIRALAEIRSAQAKNIALIREREQALITHFKEKYGIDALSSSFLGADRQQEEAA